MVARQGAEEADTEGGGARQQAPQHRREPGFVDVAVRDTGRGMTRRDQERAMERFYRGDNDAKGGFGLGLAIVAAAAKAMGSELEIDSARGRGTTVRMKLRAGRLVTA